MTCRYGKVIVVYRINTWCEIASGTEVIAVDQERQVHLVYSVRIPAQADH